MTNVTRRRALTLLGMGALTPVLLPRSTAQAAASCSAAFDQQEVGPFYVDEGLVRSNIVSGQAGTPLTVTVTVMDSDTCAPLSGAAVDIWHANAAGTYSDESSESTVGVTYLRGIQIADDNGQVTFTTIYPGWYSGRTIHIHAKIRTGGTVSGTSYSGGTTDWIGQLFFPEATSTTVASTAPYSSSTTTRTVNSGDRVYTQQDGVENLMTVTGGSSGYTATSTLYVSGGDATAATCTISGATSRTTTHGATVTLTGTAPAGRSVEVFFRAKGESAYTKRRTLTATSSGSWSTTYVSTTSYAIYAEAGDDVSDNVAILLAPSISGAATRVVTKGSKVTITGYDVPNTTTTLKFHRAGTTGYTVTRQVATNSSGVWTKTYVADGDMRFYAIGANGLTSANHVVQAR